MIDALILLGVALLIAGAGTVMVVRGGIEHNRRRSWVGVLTIQITPDITAFMNALTKIGESFGQSAKEMNAMSTALRAAEPEE